MDTYNTIYKAHKEIMRNLFNTLLTLTHAKSKLEIGSIEYERIAQQCEQVKAMIESTNLPLQEIAFSFLNKE